MKSSKAKGSEENVNTDEEDYELDEQEKLFYQMIWGKVWDEEYPPEGSPKVAKPGKSKS